MNEKARMDSIRAFLSKLIHNQRMKHPFLIVTALLFCSPSFSAEEVQIKMISTDLNGEKFEIPDSKTIVQVAPNSKVKIEYKTKVETIELIKGMVRTRVLKQNKKKDNEPKLILKTGSAIMGVRGTDFLAITTPVLDESEIIVFEGKVDFSSRIDQKDSKQVAAGQWGGIGGRFGMRIHDLINLPKTALDHFDKASSVGEEAQKGN